MRKMKPTVHDLLMYCAWNHTLHEEFRKQAVKGPRHITIDVDDLDLVMDEVERQANGVGAGGAWRFMGHFLLLEGLTP